MIYQPVSEEFKKSRRGKRGSSVKVAQKHMQKGDLKEAFEMEYLSTMYLYILAKSTLSL